MSFDFSFAIKGNMEITSSTADNIVANFNMNTTQAYITLDTTFDRSSDGYIAFLADVQSVDPISGYMFGFVGTDEVPLPTPALQAKAFALLKTKYDEILGEMLIAINNYANTVVTWSNGHLNGYNLHDRKFTDF